jgi:transcriptional regulator with XRE-family HTH domain
MPKKKPRKAYGWATGTPHPMDVHVGSRLLMGRVLLGLNQAELGEAVGVTFQQLQKYEKGTNRISASRLFDLSHVLNVPIGFLFDDTPVKVTKGGDAELSPSAEAEFMSKRETLELVRAYTRIADPTMRQAIRDLITALGKG